MGDHDLKGRLGITSNTSLLALITLAHAAAANALNGATFVFFNNVDRTNIQANRSNPASPNSPVDPSKVGISNAGSDTSSSPFGPTNGATGNFSTIGGGDRNAAAGDYSTVAGGYRNVASGEWAAVAGGAGNVASGDGSFVLGGENNAASGQDSAVGGSGSYAVGHDSFAFGSSAVAFGQGAVAFGLGSGDPTGVAAGVARGNYSFVAGNLCTAAFTADVAIGRGTLAESTNAGAAFAWGIGGQALADAAEAGGLDAVASNATERALAGGQITTPGDAQAVDLVLHGQDGPSGPTSLQFGDTVVALQQLTLQPNRMHTIDVIASAMSDADQAGFRTTVYVSWDGVGALTFSPVPAAVVADATNSTAGARAGAGGWQLSFADGFPGNPGQLSVMFTQAGPNQTTVNVACKLDRVEVAVPV